MILSKDEKGKPKLLHTDFGNKLIHGDDVGEYIEETQKWTLKWINLIIKTNMDLCSMHGSQS